MQPQAKPSPAPSASTSTASPPAKSPPSPSSPPEDKKSSEGSTSSDAYDTDKLPVGPTEKGRWNVCVGFLGKPGAGKTQGAVRFALQLARKPGCYIVCHDNNWRVPDTLHDGKPTGVVRHEDANGAAQALSSSKTAKGIHCIPSPDAEAVIDIATAVAAGSMEAHGGDRGFPSLVFIDEAVAAGVCKTNYLAPSMQDLLATRRHKNVGIVYTVQSPRLAHNQLLTLATALHVYRLTNERDLDSLRIAGIPEDCIEAIKKLPDFQCVVIPMSNPENWGPK